MTGTSQPAASSNPDSPRDRETVADQRDAIADRRDQEADRRDSAGDKRDSAAHGRDAAAFYRDAAASDRDAAADRRDVIADERDRAANEQKVPSAARLAAATQVREGRRASAMDRELSLRDRDAGADQRNKAERDRSTAFADRTFGAAGRLSAGTDRDASARERLAASLDTLTGAYVRGPGLLQLERELDRAQRTHQPLSIAFVDVDHLKQVNDAGGHAAGDRLLVRVAAALRHRLRPYDLVIRYGGDEFICVFTDVETPDAQDRLSLVNTDLSQQGSVSVGVVAAEASDDVPALLARADAAMYARRAHRAPPPPE